MELNYPIGNKTNSNGKDRRAKLPAMLSKLLRGEKPLYENVGVCHEYKVLTLDSIQCLKGVICR